MKSVAHKFVVPSQIFSFAPSEEYGPPVEMPKTVIDEPLFPDALSAFKVKIIDDKIGNGAIVPKGSEVTVHYTGGLPLKNGVA